MVMANVEKCDANQKSYTKTRKLPSGISWDIFDLNITAWSLLNLSLEVVKYLEQMGRKRKSYKVENENNQLSVFLNLSSVLSKIEAVSEKSKYRD